MGKKIMNTVLFLVVLGGCVAMTLLTGNGSSGTMIYNFAFLAVMAVIYLAGLFGGSVRQHWRGSCKRNAGAFQYIQITRKSQKRRSFLPEGDV